MRARTHAPCKENYSPCKNRKYCICCAKDGEQGGIFEKKIDTITNLGQGKIYCHDYNFLKVLDYAQFSAETLKRTEASFEEKVNKFSP